MNNSINQDTCKKCKLCIEVCPCNILAINKTDKVSFIPERESICLECGQCMAVCSTKSIVINNYTYENDFIDLPENKIDYNNFYNFAANRRSVRNFKNKPVPNDLIKQVIDILSFAPFGSAPEKMNITVINNRNKIEEALPLIEHFLDNIVTWIESPFISYMIKRKKGKETLNTLKHHLYPIAKLENYKLKYGDRITRGAPAIIIFHAENDAEEHTNNSLIYATYTMFAAQSVGLGASMNGIVPAAINKVENLKELFKIPKNHEAIISVTLGYPKIKYKRTIIRKKHQVNWIN